MSGVTILVDMDGVIADFDLAFYDHCADRGYTLHSTIETQCHRFATNCIIDSTERQAARSYVDKSDWFRYLPVIPGAIEGLNDLLSHPGVGDLFLCTKPMKANRKVHSSKAAWVNRHLGKDWLDRLIISPDKGMVRGHVLLDDAPKSQWFTRAEWQPVIYPTPWNGPDSKWAAKEGCENAARWDWSMPVDQIVETAKVAKASRRVLV